MYVRTGAAGHDATRVSVYVPPEASSNHRPKPVFQTPPLGALMLVALADRTLPMVIMDGNGRSGTERGPGDVL